MKRFLLIAASLSSCVSYAEDVDFDTEIVPLLSKLGCNAASCHGGAAGRGGFRLSLFGGDPEFDYRTIVRELAGRRVNQVRPLESLLLLKPTGQLEHGGGDILDADGTAAKTIRNWIVAGTRRLKIRKLKRLEVAPRSFVGDSVPATFQISVTAKFDDGFERNVTSEAVYVSQNESALQVDEVGLVTITRPGRHTVIAKFLGHAKAVSVTTPIGSEAIEIPKHAKKNWIDDEINATLISLRIPPAAPTDDATFLRRVSLDLTGRLPEPDLVERFLASSDESKRSTLVDELLNSTAFVEFWTYQLATRIRLRKPGTDDTAAHAFHAWLKQQVAADAGWDHIADSLVTSEGDTHQLGAAAVHRFFATARDEAEYMSEVLMGVRLRCANCHNHPLDQWTQDDYHGLAAIFSGIERGRHVRFTGRGDVIHPRTATAARAKIPGRRFLSAGADERQEFVDWLTAADNPYFAKAMVGQVWEALMGRGLVTPVDDLRVTNPASHPQLLNRLSEFFVEHEYKLKPLIRLTCNSAVYERHGVPMAGNLQDDRYYSHALGKQLSAEILSDAICDVTDTHDQQNGLHQRAINVADRETLWASLQFLGQCLPDEACSPGSTGRGIASQLHLMNGELLNEKISDPAGRLRKLLNGNMATADIVSEFYVRALTRHPSEQELADWVERIDSTADRRERVERCEDFLWALLNCHEFTTNH